MKHQLLQKCSWTQEGILRHSLWLQFHGCHQGMTSAEHLKYNLKTLQPKDF